MSQLKQNQWECNNCTFIQSKSNSVCELCGTTQFQSNQISCKQCTFMQSSDNNKCEICQSPLQNDQSHNNHSSHTTQYDDKFDSTKIQTLIAMGFDETAAKKAWRHSRSDIHIAAQYLLNNTNQNRKKTKKKYSCDGYIDECSYSTNLRPFMQKFNSNHVVVEGIMQRLKEFHHLLLFHTTDPEFEQIYNLFGGQCDIEQCTAYGRHYRNEKHAEKLAFKDIASMQIMDTIHCYYCHSFDIGSRLMISEKIMIQNNERKTDTKYENATFQTINNILCEKHDRHRSDKGDRIGHNKFVSTGDVKENDGNVYSFGVEFQYTKQKNYNNFMLNAYRKSIANIPDPIPVQKKYANLKTELRTNSIHTLTIGNYHVTYTNAQRKFKSKQKLFRSRPTLKHFLCIMIRCNFDSFQYEFNKTYRRKDKRESNESVAARHANFYWLAKYLKEVMNEYGEQFIDRKYYHGISKSMLFNTLKGNCVTHGIAIWSPLSTTDQFAVAACFAGKTCGIIVEFGSYDSNQAHDQFGGYYKRRHVAKCLSVDVLSRYPNEKESLFVQSIESISIINIISALTGKEYGGILLALQLITDLISEEPVSNIFDKCVINLATVIVGHQLSTMLEEYKPFGFDAYAQELMKVYFTHSVKRLFINWRAMFTKSKYSSITALFCRADLSWIDLTKLSVVFRGAIELKICGITVTKEILDDILLSIERNINCSLEVILFDDLNATKFIPEYQHKFKKMKFDIRRWTVFFMIESETRSEVVYVYDKQ